MPQRPRRLRALPTLALLALPVLLAACGGDADGDADGGPAAADQVTIQDFAYDPSTITVAVGDTVTWTNEDSTAHTVTAGEPGTADDRFDESAGASGGTASVTFDEAGTVAYFCSIHPNMTGEVVVE